MIGGIIATHAGLAAGLLEAVEMIAGKQENLLAVSLQEGDGLEILIERLQKAAAVMEKEELVIFTDLFGATPFHAASVLSAQTGCHVVCGVNLPLLLDFTVKRESKSLEDIKESLHAVSENDYRWIEQSDII
ncbi:PTS sugar transporter subunit IIA [[Clostridium] innocuum]|nr:PTS sugar transporter subunit IIA [Erysipelotrichaceae bacterium]MCR0382114.1 PTS sugar transporter subunit IIA [[Clostridium] innocuum]MCR0413350.1 PTS sugar transporter subunit IIA [[Clostridium] innocuum]MCR0535703.1 PTS sugar transporter subunit IIA [[Clostridium] innocuum]MCR0539739.1 PTS sugar transporter subunit IIA [[Clostridium] innocuum]